MDLGVTGWVANESDGSVRVVAEGSRRSSRRCSRPWSGARRGDRRAGERDLGRRHAARCATSASVRAGIAATDALTPSARGDGTGGLFPPGPSLPIVQRNGPELARRGPADAVSRHPGSRRPPRGGRRAGRSGRVRTQATAAYSRAWDDRARRQLEGLLRRAERPTAAERALGRGEQRRADTGASQPREPNGDCRRALTPAERRRRPGRRLRPCHPPPSPRRSTAPCPPTPS